MTVGVKVMSGSDPMSKAIGDVIDDVATEM